MTNQEHFRLPFALGSIGEKKTKEGTLPIIKVSHSIKEAQQNDMGS